MYSVISMSCVSLRSFLSTGKLLRFKYSYMNEPIVCSLVVMSMFRNIGGKLINSSIYLSSMCPMTSATNKSASSVNLFLLSMIRMASSSLNPGTYSLNDNNLPGMYMRPPVYAMFGFTIDENDEGYNELKSVPHTCVMICSLSSLITVFVERL